MLHSSVLGDHVELQNVKRRRDSLERMGVIQSGRLRYPIPFTSQKPPGPGQGSLSSVFKNLMLIRRLIPPPSSILMTRLTMARMVPKRGRGRTS